MDVFWATMIVVGALIALATIAVFVWDSWDCQADE
jgi:hypothetical protein